jgi:hypothetical protein
MTPPDPPPGADDDLDREPTDDELAVHAVLDGEATAAQRRRVASDPGLRARVTEMKAVVDQVAAPPQAPSEDVFDAIRAAAAAHLDDSGEVVDLRDEVLAREAADEDEDDDPADQGVDDDLTDLDEREAVGGMAVPGREDDDRDIVVPIPRPEPRPRRRWPALPAVAAAILVLVALGVGLIVTDGGDGDADFSAVSSAIGGDHDGAGGADDAAGEESASDGVQERDETDTESAPTTTAAPASGDVSQIAPQASFPDQAALREVLQQVDPATLVLDPGPQGFEDGRRAGNLRQSDAAEVARCSSVLQSSDDAIGPAQAAVAVEVDGERLLVLSSPVEATQDGPARVLLHVVDPVSCVPRFAVQR